MQISPPRSGITAFQVGAIIGVVSGLLVGGPWWIPSGLLILIVDFLVPIVALLLAGLLAARHTGRASTGTLAATTTFTLTVTNSAGTSVTAQTTVTVVPAPVITSFIRYASNVVCNSQLPLRRTFLSMAND